MIDLTIAKEGRAHNIARAREQGIIIPTLREMQHPEEIPEKIREKLTGDVDGNKEISVNDLTGIVNLVLGKASSAPSNALFSYTDAVALTGSGNELTLHLNELRHLPFSIIEPLHSIKILSS